MSELEALLRRYRTELRRLVAERRRLDAEIAARRRVLRDLRETRGDAPPRRGRLTQTEAVRRVLEPGGPARTAGEIYAAAREAGAGGSERSLRNVLSRLVKVGELAVDRSTFPQRYYREKTWLDGAG